MSVTVRRVLLPMMVGLVTVAGGLVACASGSANGPVAAGSSVPSVDGSASSGPALPSSPQTPSVTTTPAGTDRFVLAEGDHRSVCGISLAVKFIPPSANGGSQDQAFLVGEAPSSASGDEPSPSTLAPARAGETATVVGQRFSVIAVDVINARVTLDPLC